MSTRTIVTTHGYTDHTTISVCEAHAAPNFSPRGASYSGVSHGRHQGVCSVCADAQGECDDCSRAQGVCDACRAAGVTS